LLSLLRSATNLRVEALFQNIAPAQSGSFNLSEGVVLNVHDSRHYSRYIMSKSGGVDSIVLIKLPLSKWHAYINGPTFADAILDRLTAKYLK